MKAGIVAIVCALCLGAQSIPRITLQPASGILSEEFSDIVSVRELTDGRLLVSDAREKRIVVADFRGNSVQSIGRVGDGPEEFHTPGRLWAIAGDSTLMKDGGGYPYITVFIGARIAGRISTESPASLAVSRGSLRGADLGGHVIASVLPRRTPGQPPASTGSYSLIRFDRRANRTDTVARVASGTAVSGTASGGPAGAPTGTPRYVVSLATGDAGELFPDGMIAIVRMYPYRVEWCTPDLKCTEGPLLRANDPPMTDRERRAWLGYVRIAGNWPPTDDIARTTGWPGLVPPTGGRFFPEPAGRLVIERFPVVEGPPLRYDIVDRNGRLAAQVLLPLNERIAGFGPRSVYIVATDSVGLQRLRRHPWP
jgi:hypothetical protein